MKVWAVSLQANLLLHNEVNIFELGEEIGIFLSNMEYLPDRHKDLLTEIQDNVTCL